MSQNCNSHENPWIPRRLSKDASHSAANETSTTSPSRENVTSVARDGMAGTGVTRSDNVTSLLRDNATVTAGVTSDGNLKSQSREGVTRNGMTSDGDGETIDLSDDVVPSGEWLRSLSGDRTLPWRIVRRLDGRDCQDGRCYKEINQKGDKDDDIEMCASCHHVVILENGVKNGDISSQLLGEKNKDDAKYSSVDSICYSKMKQPTDKELPKPIRRFYKRQNELIQTYEEIHACLRGDGQDDEKAEKKTLKLASTMSIITFICNLLLLVSKCVAAVLSGSLVIISSLLDSAMDLVSGLLMWCSSRAIKHTNYNLYPKGRRKLEPVAIVVLAVIMSFVSVQLIHESIQKMFQYAFINFDQELNRLSDWTATLNVTDVPEAIQSSQVGFNASDWPVLLDNILHLKRLLQECARGHASPVFETPTIIICAATIATKLFLFLICRRIDNPSVQALAKDHFNDVISNSGAIACGIIGYKCWKYADPLGAILISLSIIINWSITAHDQIRRLTGYTARPTFIQKITWLALNHDDRIQHIDSVIAFHFGNRFLVELQIVLPGDMTMRESHDLTEALQQKIERLPEVERAFIHIDYESGYYMAYGGREAWGGVEVNGEGEKMRDIGAGNRKVSTELEVTEAMEREEECDGTVEREGKEEGEEGEEKENEDAGDPIFRRFSHGASPGSLTNVRDVIIDEKCNDIVTSSKTFPVNQSGFMSKSLN